MIVFKRKGGNRNNSNHQIPSNEPNHAVLLDFDLDLSYDRFDIKTSSAVPARNTLAKKYLDKDGWDQHA